MISYDHSSCVHPMLIGWTGCGGEGANAQQGRNAAAPAAEGPQLCVTAMLLYLQASGYATCEQCQWKVISMVAST